MKKLLSLIISLALIISVATTAFVTNSNEENLYIPSPDEIQELYDHLTASRATEETLFEYILSDNSDISDQPLLQLGVLSSFAETQNDLSILIMASSLVKEEIMPNLTANDYISILTNDDYTNAFKFSIIDTYSYASASDTTRNTADFSLVDEELRSFIHPNNDLSIVALTSINDKSTIGYSELANLFNNGTIEEKQVALKFMNELYPTNAFSKLQR